MKRNFLFEELQPICTAISLSSDDIEVNSDQDFEAKKEWIAKQVDEYIASQKKGIVYNAVNRYGGWVRTKMIKAATNGYKLEYC